VPRADAAPGFLTLANAPAAPGSELHPHHPGAAPSPSLLFSGVVTPAPPSPTAPPSPRIAPFSPTAPLSPSPPSFRLPTPHLPAAESLPAPGLARLAPGLAHPRTPEPAAPQAFLPSSPPAPALPTAPAPPYQPPFSAAPLIAHGAAPAVGGAVEEDVSFPAQWGAKTFGWSAQVS